LSYLIVLTTVPNQKEAKSLSGLLLRKRLTACVQISSAVKSYYWWKGKIEKSREFQLWIKTASSKFPQLLKTLKKHHSYDVPEVLAFPVSKGNPDYFAWLAGELKT
jgi:periplasmic divalent cation tolerance protein